MKERELRQHAECDVCHRKIGEARVPLFWRVTAERFGLDLNAMRRQTGLAMMLGGHVGLASVMGPDEDMAKPVMDKVTLTVCEDCACDHTGRLMSLCMVALEKSAKAEVESEQVGGASC